MAFTFIRYGLPMKTWTPFSVILWGIEMNAMLRFFMICFMRSRKMFWMAVLALIPVGYAVLLRIIQPIFLSADFSSADLFPKMAFSLYLHFLLPLMSVFIGTAVLLDEIDTSTMSYLLTRPIPRWQILLSKTLISEILLSSLLVVSLFLTYLLMTFGGGGEGSQSNLKIFFQITYLILIGCLIYVPLFCLVGGIVKKPLLVALFFTFGWEKIVGSLPGSLKYFTVIHYLNSLAPAIDQGHPSGLLRLLMSAESSPPLWRTVLTILLMIAGFHFISSSLLSWREYAFHDE